MIDQGQMVSVIVWIALLTGFHLSLYPWIKRQLPTIAVPVSWTGGVILTTLASWYVVLAAIPPIAGLLPIILAFAGACISGRISLYRNIPQEWRYYLLFIVVFGAMLIVRAYNPDINGAEKFMDHGFLASILRTPLVPPLDPWFAGGYLNVYYYLGHWMIGAPGIIANIPSNILFNLALPTIAALSAINIYGAGHLILKHTRLLPVLAFFIVNPFFIYLALTGTASFTLLWDSSRVIQNTINEYPLFSFLFGDVHAHVLGILPQTFLILMVTAAITCWKMDTGARFLIIILTALGLSTIPAVNSWDILIWAPMILATGVCLIAREYPGLLHLKGFGILKRLFHDVLADKGYAWIKKPGTAAFFYVILVPILSMLLISPLLIGMQTQGIEGIGFVHTPSLITEFLLVHGWFFLGFLFSFRANLIKIPWIIVAMVPLFLTGYFSAGLTGLVLILVLHRRKGAADLLAAGGLAILLFCELIYLTDNMGETYYRMNTVFKLYIGAWLLCGTSAALMIGREVEEYMKSHSGLKTRVIQSSLIILLCLCLVVPPVVVSTMHGAHTPTLDGMAWLSSSHPEDAEAITFLRSLSGDHVLVEAAGDDYAYTSRVSSFTGIPTIVGWQFHEYMWRGNNPEGWYAKRGNDIRNIYEDPGKTLPLMELYKADLLYVGPEEQSKYSISLPLENLQVLYKNRDVVIYQHVQDQNTLNSGNITPIRTI